LVRRKDSINQKFSRTHVPAGIEQLIKLGGAQESSDLAVLRENGA
jgi:hypothetical protein